MLSLILLTIAGAVIAAVVGTLWYSNATPMGKIHMRSMGFDKLSDADKKKKMEEGKAMMGKMYTAQILLSLLTSFAVVFVVTESLRNGLTLPMAMGFVIFNWLCFMVPIIGSGVLWSNCDRSIAWKKFFSDIVENLITVLLIALLAGIFA